MDSLQETKVAFLDADELLVGEKVAQMMHLLGEIFCLVSSLTWKSSYTAEGIPLSESAVLYSYFF